MNLLLLDSGHAKNTAGKVAPDKSMYEWEFNNDMQYKIKKRAEEHGIVVFLSNPNPSTVKDIPLTTRAELMNNYWISKGRPKSIMISLHSNAHLSDRFSDARGTETYVAGNSSSTSKNFAKDVNTEIYNAIKNIDSGAKDRGVKTENFTVIYKTYTPCVLIEYGFYSNQQDLKVLKNNRDDLAEATVKTICKYFNVTYKPKNTTVEKPVEQPKHYANCVLYGNDIDKVGAEIIGWAKQDCIVKHIDNHVKWEASNLFVIGGVTETKMKELNNGENYSVIKGVDRYDTVRQALKFIGK